VQQTPYLPGLEDKVFLFTMWRWHVLLGVPDSTRSWSIAQSSVSTRRRLHRVTL